MKEVKFKDLPIKAIFVTNRDFSWSGNRLVFEKDSSITAVVIDLSKLLGNEDRVTRWDFKEDETIFLPDSTFVGRMEVYRNSLISDVSISNYIIDKINSRNNYV